jgi:hypothetical protein
METKCSNCSGPVFIPLDRGVSNCKNCGQLAGRYCPDCKIALPIPIETCPGCGRDRKEINKSYNKAYFKKELPTILITCAVVIAIVLGGVNCVKGCERDSEKSNIKRQQDNIAVAQYVDKEIRPVVEQSGARLSYTDPHFIQVQFQGPIASEYEAERIAQKVLSLMPDGSSVKILDDAGIVRADVNNYSIIKGR